MILGPVFLKHPVYCIVYIPYTVEYLVKCLICYTAYYTKILLFVTTPATVITRLLVFCPDPKFYPQLFIFPTYY